MGRDGRSVSRLGSIASGVERTPRSNGEIPETDRSRAGTDPGLRRRAALDRTMRAGFTPMCMLLVAGHPAARAGTSSTSVSRRLAKRAESVAENLPLGERVRRLAHHERSTRGCTVRAGGVVSWPTICVRSPERSIVIIDIAPIDEDQVTRRALPDTITTCGSFGQARRPHRRHDQIGHFLTGRVRAQRHRRLRRVEAALHIANDPTAIIREEV